MLAGEEGNLLGELKRPASPVATLLPQVRLTRLRVAPRDPEHPHAILALRPGSESLVPGGVTRRAPARAEEEAASVCLARVPGSLVPHPASSQQHSTGPRRSAGRLVAGQMS